VLTNREQRQFESSSYLAGGVFLTLTAQTPTRVAQATFRTIQESRVRLMPHPQGQHSAR
jgi:hypothetical protein